MSSDSLGHAYELLGEGLSPGVGAVDIGLQVATVTQGGGLIGVGGMLGDQVGPLGQDGGGGGEGEPVLEGDGVGVLERGEGGEEEEVADEGGDTLAKGEEVGRAVGGRGRGRGRGRGLGLGVRVWLLITKNALKYRDHGVHRCSFSRRIQRHVDHEF